MQYAVLDGLTVINVVLLDDPSDWVNENPALAIRQSDAACIGDVWDGAQFQRPASAIQTTSSLDVKTTLCQQVDEAAETVLQRYITPGSGMAMVYQEKMAQALAVAALGEAAANAMSAADREAQYPTLSASVGIEAATLWGCAQLVLTKYTQFATLSLSIERSRLQGKAAIKAAATESEAVAAHSAIAWPSQ